MQAWFYAFKIIDNNNNLRREGSGTFGSATTQGEAVVAEQKKAIAEMLSCSEDWIIFTAFNKI